MAIAFLGRCFLLSILSIWLECGISDFLLAVVSPMCSVELFLDARARTSNGYILYIDLIIVVHCVHNLWTNTTMIVQRMNQHNDDSSRVIVLVLWVDSSRVVVVVLWVAHRYEYLQVRVYTQNEHLYLYFEVHAVYRTLINLAQWQAHSDVPDCTSGTSARTCTYDRNLGTYRNKRYLYISKYVYI